MRRVSISQERSPRASNCSYVCCESTDQYSPVQSPMAKQDVDVVVNVAEHNTRVSQGSVRRSSLVTVGHIEQVSSSGLSKTFYGMAILLALVLCAVIGVTVICAMSKQEKSDSMSAVDMKKSKSYDERVAALDDKQCKAIFDRHILSKDIVKDLEYAKGSTDNNVCLDEPWVKGVKNALKIHENNTLRHLFEEFEKLRTLQIAVYLGQLATYLGSKNDGERESWKTLRASMGFAGSIFNMIIHDKTMRQYLASRGLRSQMDKRKIGKKVWGTIIYDHIKGDATTAGWRWIDDSDKVTVEIKRWDTGEQGTWNSVYNWPRDTAGTGANSFKVSKMQVRPGTDRILCIGQMD